MLTSYDMIYIEVAKMIIHNDVIILNKKEIAKLIDTECKDRLGMSSREFMRKRKDGTLPRSLAVHDIEMLLKLG